MSVAEVLFGRPLRSEEEGVESVGPITAVPVLGLDAIASAAYGPEAALTVLLPAGAAGVRLIAPLTAAIVVLLLLVYFSYRQTIAAYPNGGGSYTVAKENLGPRLGLLAAGALALDYTLNVAVAISAGVGALVSAVPALQPHTVALCLALLGLLTLVNLRGVRSAGVAFVLPTFLFVVCLLGTMALGVARTLQSGGHPPSMVHPAPMRAATTAVGAWLLLRAFASGCTAMTGVEAVSNAVPIFRRPAVPGARRALTIIIGILVLLLAGQAVLCRAYGVGATMPGQPGYQSVLSQLVAAIAGRGAFYYLTISAVVAVLCLSANTSFADFPRLCRVLAADSFMPGEFARRGRRLVYSRGVLLLAAVSGLLLLLFGGVTDHLIPLFAVGALLAFTLSQLGMVAHWRRTGGAGARRRLLVNAVGAAGTALALLIVAVSKFREGAWATLLVMPAAVAVFAAVRRHYARVEREVATDAPLDVGGLAPPILVVPLIGLDRVARKALRFALRVSPDIQAVQFLTESVDEQRDLTARWPELVESPAAAAGLPVPRLVVLRSPYRSLIKPLLEHVQRLARTNPERFIAVLVPEVVEHRWYHYLLHRHRATLLKAALLLRGGPQIAVINTPWYLRR